MKFLIDADSPHSLIEVFNKHSHEAVHVRDVLGAATDDKILEYANKNQQVIVTRDLGFAQTFIEKRGVGLIIARLPYYFRVNKINEAFEEFLKKINYKELVSSITVLELGRYRIKKL